MSMAMAETDAETSSWSAAIARAVSMSSAATAVQGFVYKRFVCNGWETNNGKIRTDKFKIVEANSNRNKKGINNMETKRFRKINEGFVCRNCKQKVFALHNGSCRNHCPSCLYSLHVDCMPGDRSESCEGLMKPISIDLDARRGQLVVHQCAKCGTLRRNKLALSDSFQPDHYDTVIQIVETNSMMHEEVSRWKGLSIPNYRSLFS